MNRTMIAAVALGLALALCGGCSEHRIEDGYGVHVYVSEDQHYHYPYWVEHDYYRPMYDHPELVHVHHR